MEKINPSPLKINNYLIASESNNLAGGRVLFLLRLLSSSESFNTPLLRE